MSYKMKFTDILSDKRFYRDLVILAIIGIIGSYEFIEFDSFDRLYDYTRAHEDWELDELLIIFTVAIITLTILFFSTILRRLKKQTHELILANQELESRRKKEKFMALGEMASGMAHEINNSLQPVLGMSDILIRKFKNKDKDATELCEIIHESALHGRHIVESVLDFSREKGGLDQEEYEAGSALLETLQFVQSIQSKELIINIEEPPFSALDSKRIICSKTGLVQIFTNLFKNASDAMHGKGRLSIDVNLLQLNEKRANALNIHARTYIVLGIEDSGPGIPKDQIENIFNPFYTTKEEGQGTGLGLSTVYGIMRQFNGTITAIHNKNKGARFELYFPILE